MANTTSPLKGLITWDSEGNEGGDFHSRKLHVPGDTSGATVGRGYDMKNRTASAVLNDLVQSGVDLDTAQKMSGCAGLQGQQAKDYISRNGLGSLEISKEAQVKLFETEYLRQSADVKRICTKPDVQKKFGNTKWSEIHPGIKELLIDLKFRGDYTPATRTLIQSFAAKNDFAGLLTVLGNRSLWMRVPQDRYARRLKFFINVAGPYLKKSSK